MVDEAGGDPRRRFTGTVAQQFLARVRSYLHDETRGSVAVMTALMLPILIGIGGLAVDASLWMANKSMAQGASDNAGRALLKAVIAGATSDQAKQLARDVAKADGYTNGVGGVTVTISGPTSGAYRVQISQTQSLFFGSLGLRNAPTVAAQTTVDAPYTMMPPCIVALDPHADSGTLSVQGNPTVSTSSCNIDNNSTSATGTTVAGSAILTTSNTFQTPGNYSGTITAATYLTGNAAYATSDPFASLPTPATPTAQQCTTYSGNGTLTPGVYYCGDVTIHQSITLTAGTYYFSGGKVTLNGQGSIDGSAGVTLIFVNGATIQINGSSPMNLVAPASGTYQGVAIYDVTNRTSPSGSFGTINGTSLVTINGAVYTPGQTLAYAGTNTSTCTKLVAYQISFVGTSSFTDGSSCRDGINGGNGGNVATIGMY